MVMEVAGEYWFVLEGKDTNGWYCWKTQNGNGAKLNKGEMVDIRNAGNDAGAKYYIASSTHNGDIQIYDLD
jgi:hypothetical protein